MRSMEMEHSEGTQVDLGPGDGCVVVREAGGCEFLIPTMEENEVLRPDLVLLMGFAMGMVNRDQRLIDLLLLIIEETRKAAGEE
jgi:hypothetical protein